MSNIEIYANMVDGSLHPSHRKGDSCRNLVIKTIGDDTGPPARNLIIKIDTESGKTVEVIVPNNQSEAIVRLDGEII